MTLSKSRSTVPSRSARRVGPQSRPGACAHYRRPWRTAVIFGAADWDLRPFLLGGCVPTVTNMSTGVVIGLEGLDQLVKGLRARGYRVVGPVLRNNAITLGEVEGAADLPRGWQDKQEAGRYEVTQTGSGSRFGWAVGPDSMKSEMFPPRDALAGQAARLPGRGDPRRRCSRCCGRGQALRPRRAGCPRPRPGRDGRLRPHVPAPPPSGLRRSRGMHAAGRNLLLRGHGDRPRRHRRLRPCPHRAKWRRGPTRRAGGRGRRRQRRRGRRRQPAGQARHGQRTSLPGPSRVATGPGNTVGRTATPGHRC